MENVTEIIEAIERVVGFLILISAAIGVLYTAITTGQKALIDTRAKASVDIKTAELAKIQADNEIEIAKKKVDLEVEIAKEKADIELDEAKIGMVEKAEGIYKRLLQEVEKKLADMQIELDNVKKEVRQKDIYREAGIKLIHVIEEGVRLRAKTSVDLNNCKDCMLADQKLLVTLKEVKTLFENGDK